jgi:catechol 2,3-dioxygenase-like lactoylglutathione lyase family enzyme
VSDRVRLVGINHVALEVTDLEAALEFYGSIFALRGIDREPGMAFIDMGDQFIALSEGREADADTSRHFGLVVEDKEAVRARLTELGVPVLPGRRLDFRDPWGNRIQIVDYRDITFTKAAPILDGMELGDLEKRPGALDELREKGLG